MKLKLKLTNLHLFLILLFILIISSLGFNIVEGMQGSENSAASALPEGIKREEIPQGSEDLYILKSEVVPPVCPKCPDIKSECKDDKKECPPCPPCARCPEASFTCKKVPNYNAAAVGGNLPSQLPMPMLNSFATFA